MTFLQLLSTRSSQNLTYHCRNSVANYDAEERSHKKALKILGWNDIELNAMGKKMFKYEVGEDECKVTCLRFYSSYLNVIFIFIFCFISSAPTTGPRRSSLLRRTSPTDFHSSTWASSTSALLISNSTWKSAWPVSGKTSSAQQRAPRQHRNSLISQKRKEENRHICKMEMLAFPVAVSNTAI